MACQAIHFWTFTGLVGAFLDLAIAYLLLCASTIAFFTSKFLGFLGLSLPCPCDGQFISPNSNYCLQRLLVDSATEKVSSVQLFVKSKFPFDSILGKDQKIDLQQKLVRDGNNYGNGFFELEGEAWCSSISDAKKSQNVGGRDSFPRNENAVELGVMSLPGLKERRFDMKGKGITNQKPKTGIRRRRKGGFDHGKISSVSSYDPTFADQYGVPRSPPSVNKEHNETNGGKLVPVKFGVEGNRFHDDGETFPGMVLADRGSHDFELNQPLDEEMHTANNASFDKLLRSDARGVHVDGDAENTIRVLEQALEEEEAARGVLYLELEKERNAAATAADEAMAMILRLQEEKASIEMEARQYQRIIEEKSAYDAEEMNILKEILLRREREKHFLEKEVESYRQMMFPENEKSEGFVHHMVDRQREHLASELDLTEDPDLMLHQLSASIDKKEILNDRTSKLDATFIDNQKFTQIRGQDKDADYSQLRNLDMQFSLECIDGGNQELQEKEMISVDSIQHVESSAVNLETCLYKPSSSQAHNLLETTIPIGGEGQENNDSVDVSEGVPTKSAEIQSENVKYDLNEGQDLEIHGNVVSLGSTDPYDLVFDKELHVHDVHVIDDKSKSFKDVGGNNSELLSFNDNTSKANHSDIQYDASAIPRIDYEKDCASSSRLVKAIYINRTSLDMAIGRPPLGSRSRPLLPDLRRSSMSALDTERIKIDTEVEWLRERLKIVQEGREKLSLSMEHRERERLQLKLLEDIASQLREIRQLTEPGKSMRQVSLPSPSSKVTSKKRRCRSASICKQVNESS